MSKSQSNYIKYINSNHAKGMQTRSPCWLLVPFVLGFERDRGKIDQFECSNKRHINRHLFAPDTKGYPFQ